MKVANRKSAKSGGSVDSVSNAMGLKKGSKNMAKKSDKVASNVAVPSAGTMDIPLSRIIVDAEFNARTQGMDEDSIKTFAETLKREGLLQPVVVEPLDNGDFFLKAGFRRLSAAKLLGWPTITATVKVAEGENKKEQELNRYFTNLAENVARRNLTAYDTAMRCKLLKKEYGLTGTDIAKRVGMNTGYVNNLLQVVGEGEKGEHKGATLHPEIMKQWVTECSWDDNEKEVRTRVCTVDTMRRWLKFDHEMQLKMFNRAMFHATHPNADMDKYDAEQAAAAAASGKPAGDTDGAAAAEGIVRATKAQLEAALEAAQAAKKATKAKEQITRFNGIIEGLKFALGVKSGHTNKIADVISMKDGKVVESAAAAAAAN